MVGWLWVATLGNRNGARAALAQRLHARHSGYSKSCERCVRCSKAFQGRMACGVFVGRLCVVFGVFVSSPLRMFEGGLTGRVEAVRNRRCWANTVPERVSKSVSLPVAGSGSPVRAALGAKRSGSLPQENALCSTVSSVCSNFTRQCNRFRISFCAAPTYCLLSWRNRDGACCGSLAFT